MSTRGTRTVPSVKSYACAGRRTLSPASATRANPYASRRRSSYVSERIASQKSGGENKGWAGRAREKRESRGSWGERMEQRCDLLPYRENEDREALQQPDEKDYPVCHVVCLARFTIALSAGWTFVPFRMNKQVKNERTDELAENRYWNPRPQIVRESREAHAERRKQSPSRMWKIRCMYEQHAPYCANKDEDFLLKAGSRRKVANCKARVRARQISRLSSAFSLVASESRETHAHSICSWLYISAAMPQEIFEAMVANDLARLQALLGFEQFCFITTPSEVLV
ncbi:hypothetical protein B0H14DRAFT_3762903 [Mycena olivaceomarginata]|nr:hypothetical protein B0H14DRAFT_3762903 [Mycena olivaceomarginata]